MRIVAFSDSHGRLDFKVPQGDVLVIAGDICAGRGRIDELAKFGSWISKLPHKHKIYVPGNHDVIVEKDRSLVKTLMPGVTYLEDDYCYVPHQVEKLIANAGVKFWGSPVSPTFGHGWAWNRDRGEAIRRHWNLIPNDTDVLITHTPPYGTLDDVSFSGEHVGCWDLQAAIARVKPKLCLYGHIHRGKDSVRQVKIGDTIYANIGLCDDSYGRVHDPMVIDLW